MKLKHLILLVFVPIRMFAQDIEVKKFEPMAKDQTAALSPRMDINGVTCGLVKVQLKEPGAEFEGNVMGDVEFTGSEYLVYMPNGSKRLSIKHPDYLPTTIVFADYGTKRVSSSTTYELILKTNKKKAKVDNSKKGLAVFNIKPANALLLIDGQIVDGSGGVYMLSLPYGKHYYTAKSKDFSLINQVVNVDKNAKNINVDLTEFFSMVDVTCETEDAEIWINGEQKGVGKWGGIVAPGYYKIDVSKDGCHSQSRQITLRDNETLNVSFPELKTITGSLLVDFEPIGCEVILNGKKVGVTPLELKELPVGRYKIEIWKEYCVRKKLSIQIGEDQLQKIKGILDLTEFGNLYYSYQNNKNGRLLADYYRYGKAQSGNMYTLCCRDSFFVPLDPVKSIELYGLKNDMSYDNSRIQYEGLSDAEISFQWALKEVEEYREEEYEEDGEKYHSLSSPPMYALLAWHYFYGVGCKKNISEAEKLIKEQFYKGSYGYPAYKKLIEDMGLDNELKYVPCEL